MADTEAGPSSMPARLDDGPLATLRDPLPLPPYPFDPAISEDENLLTWVSILARHSSSKKGHMGTIFIRPPAQGDPTQTPSTQCQPPIQERIVQYANNYPLLYSRLAKAVPEVHAEALAISRCARRGIATEGCSVYISFPPCNDCFKLLLSAGIRRCVFKKGIPINNAQGEAALVAADVEGMQLVGTLDKVMQYKAQRDEHGETEARARDRTRDEERDVRVRRFWAGLGEDAARTRARVARWWDEYSRRYRAAEKRVYGRHGAEPPREEDEEVAANGRKARRKGQSPIPPLPRSEDVAADAVDAAKQAISAAEQEGRASAAAKSAVNGNGTTASNEDDDDDDDDIDAMRNHVPVPVIPAKRTSKEMRS